MTCLLLAAFLTCSDDGCIRHFDGSARPICAAALNAFLSAVTAGTLPSRSRHSTSEKSSSGPTRAWVPVSLRRCSVLRALATDGRQVFAAGEEGVLRSWQLPSYKALAPLELTEGNGAVRCLAVSMDGRTIAVGLEKKRENLWLFKNKELHFGLL